MAVSKAGDRQTFQRKAGWFLRSFWSLEGLDLVRLSSISVPGREPKPFHHLLDDGLLGRGFFCELLAGYVLPQIFMTCELSMMPPLSNRGGFEQNEHSAGPKVLRSATSLLLCWIYLVEDTGKRLCLLGGCSGSSGPGVVTWISRAFGGKAGECIGLNMLLHLGEAERAWDGDSLQGGQPS